MNYYEKHIGDFIRDTVGLTMIEDGAYNRLLDQLYQTERALPIDKKEVYRMARATSAPERKAVDYVLRKFFIDDGDGYTQKRAQAQIEEYWDREPASELKKENAKIRQQRSRDRRKSLFDQLRDLGVTPAFNASMKVLEAELSRVTRRDESQSGHTTVTRDDTLTQTPDTRHQTPVLKPKAEDSDDSTVPDHDPAPGVAPLPMRETPPLSEDPAIQLTVALRRLGVNALFTHPALQDWATKGVSIEILTQAVSVARESKGTTKIPPGYLVPIVNDLLNPPPAAASSQRPAREDWSWKKTDQGCNAEGAKYGLRARGGESRDSFIARIEAEKIKRKGQP